MAKKKEKNKKVVQDLRTEHGITVQQEHIAAAYAMGKSITAIAQECKVARSTIYEWFKSDYKFVAYYKTLLAEVRQETRGAISSMAAEATATLRLLMNKGSEQARLKAATYIIDKLSDDDKRVAKSKADGKKG